MPPNESGSRWKSYEVRGGIPYHYGTDKPYIGGPQDSVDGHIFRNVWNRPFIGDGCFINPSEGLPEEKFDAIFLVNDSQCIDSREFVNLIRKRYKNSIIIGTTKEVIPRLKKTSCQGENVGLGYLGDFYKMCDITILHYADQKVCDELSEEIDEKVYSLPMNYKIEEIRNKYKKSDSRSRKILAGTTDWGNRGYEECLKFCKYLAEKYNYEVVENTGNKSWDEWLRIVDEVDFMVNTDTQHRLGQPTIECITLGTPHIGGVSDAVLSIIPEWATNDTERLEEIFIHVEKNGYEKSEEHYDKLMSKYSLESVEKKLVEILENVS